MMPAGRMMAVANNGQVIMANQVQIANPATLQGMQGKYMSKSLQGHSLSSQEKIYHYKVIRFPSAFARNNHSLPGITSKRKSV